MFVRTMILLCTLAFSSIAHAHTFKKGDITVGHPWTRATPAGTSVGAGYLKITNAGKETDRLTGGTFAGAKVVEVHEMTMNDGVMKMRKLSDGLEIKPGETVELKPGSYHLMIMGLAKSIAEGPKIKATLGFEKAGVIDVEFKVEPIGAQSSSDAKEHHHH